MTKQDFKKAYSIYRKEVTAAYRKSKCDFSVAFNSNPVFRLMVSDKNCDRPVSVKCYMYFSDRKLNAAA